MPLLGLGVGGDKALLMRLPDPTAAAFFIAKVSFKVPRKHDFVPFAHFLVSLKGSWVFGNTLPIIEPPFNIAYKQGQSLPCHTMVLGDIIVFCVGPQDRLTHCGCRPYSTRPRPHYSWYDKHRSVCHSVGRFSSQHQPHNNQPRTDPPGAHQQLGRALYSYRPHPWPQGIPPQ